MTSRVNITGRTFGLLTVVEEAGRTTGGLVLWRTKCRCGKEAIVRGSALRNGHTQSCGCIRKRPQGPRPHARKHGLTGTYEYGIWCAMHHRCKKHPRYAGRGIAVDPRWADFGVFLADMGKAPSGQTLDRIDNDRDYGPENCRWATRKTQSRNTSRNVRVSVQGKLVTLVEACERVGVDPGSVSAKASYTGKGHQHAFDHFVSKQAIG